MFYVGKVSYQRCLVLASTDTHAFHGQQTLVCWKEPIALLETFCSTILSLSRSGILLAVVCSWGLPSGPRMTRVPHQGTGGDTMLCCRSLLTLRPAVLTSQAETSIVLTLMLGINSSSFSDETSVSSPHKRRPKLLLFDRQLRVGKHLGVWLAGAES